MLASSRRNLILEKVRANHEVSVVELSAELGVSTATVRRDLDLLSADGRLVRVHGGGEAIETDPDGTFEETTDRESSAKEAIARAAALFVKDGHTVLLDIGTTTARLAQQLVGRQITVITSSLEAARILAVSEATNIVVLGGMLRRSYHSLVGPLTESNLQMVSADISFLSAATISWRGELLDNTGTEVPVKKAMIAAADKVNLLADSSKFGGGGLLKAATASEIDVFITNSVGDEGSAGRAEAIACFRQAGTEVVEA